MSLSNVESEASFRRTIYWLLIMASVAGIAGRILAVQSRDRATPFLSANDRSRWCTIRALVDHGTYEIDKVIIKNPAATNYKDKFDKSWNTIDKVRHKGADGREHYYSSKPTLFTTLLAGEYWLIRQITGLSLRDDPFYVGRMMLVLTNLLPLVLYFVLMARLIEQYGTTHWGRIVAMTAAAWATFLSTFAVTLNNHLPAAISTLITIYAVLKIWQHGETRLRYFVVAGFFAAFTAANELPALSFFAIVGAALLWKQPARTWIAFAPAAAIVVVGFFYTNYLAHQSWRPAYAHRGDGPLIVEVELTIQQDSEAGRVADLLRNKLARQNIDISQQAVILPGVTHDRWILWDRQGQDRLAIVRTGDVFEVRAWDNWYHYDRSYWSGNQTGVDKGEKSQAVYALNLLIGHHGIFSLTPIWLLSLLGIVMILGNRDHSLRGFAAMVVLLSVVCSAFYISRPLIDRNYGGSCCGARWLFWFIPMWLLCALPAIDRFSHHRFGKLAVLVLLAVSIFSASYALLNPWTHPWIFNFWEYLGWINY